MPDLLREQFPYFRPIVEAFGYRNLEFEGWEADDVIATLAHRADEAGIKTTVVSTDRDAFQLVSDNVALMMTPRGVSDVHVYTPERVELRLGIRPEQVPDFIGLKGDTSDNIPGVPGIGDKTAGQLIAQYGSLEEVLEHVDELTPARSKSIREHAEQARAAKELATMRRDLELDFDPAEVVLSPPDRSQLKEMFRRFEFRNLLEPRRRARRGAARRAPLDADRRRGALARGTELTVCYLLAGRWHRGRRRTGSPLAAGDEVVVSPRPERLEGELVAHDAKALRVEAADDTMILAYLIEPGRAEYALDDLAAEYGVELLPDARGRGGDRRARPPRRRDAAAARAAARARPRARGGAALPRDRAAADRGARRDGVGRGQGRHLPDGRDHRAPGRPGRGARGEGVRAGGRGVHARLDPAGGADPVREAASSRPGRKGKTGYSTDTRVLRTIRGEHEIVRRDRGVARVLEAAQHLPRPAADADRRGRPPAHDLQPGRRGDRAALDDEPEPAGDPDPHRARPRDPLGLRRRARAQARSRPTTRRSSCGSSPTSPASRSCARRSSAGEDIHAATAAEVLGKERATLTKDERNVAKMVNFGIIYGISSFGLSENLEIPREEAQAYIDAYLARFPHVQDFIQRTIEQAARDGYVTTLLGRRRPVPEIRASNRQTRSLGERLAVNSVMQGTAADVIKVAMVAIHRRLRDEGRAARLVLQVHDELLLEVPEAEVARGQGARPRGDVRAPTRSTRRSRSTSASATTGTRRSREVRPARGP